jgi:hypothetical protein
MFLFVVCLLCVVIKAVVIARCVVKGTWYDLRPDERRGKREQEEKGRFRNNLSQALNLS